MRKSIDRLVRVGVAALMSVWVSSPTLAGGCYGGFSSFSTSLSSGYGSGVRFGVSVGSRSLRYGSRHGFSRGCSYNRLGIRHRSCYNRYTYVIPDYSYRATYVPPPVVSTRSVYSGTSRVANSSESYRRWQLDAASSRDGVWLSTPTVTEVQAASGGDPLRVAEASPRPRLVAAGEAGGVEKSSAMPEDASAAGIEAIGEEDIDAALAFYREAARARDLEEQADESVFAGDAEAGVGERPELSDDGAAVSVDARRAVAVRELGAVESAWAVLASGATVDAQERFASIAEGFPDEPAPKLGFSAAALELGRDELAVWAMRRAISLTNLRQVREMRSSIATAGASGWVLELADVAAESPVLTGEDQAFLRASLLLVGGNLEGAIVAAGSFDEGSAQTSRWLAQLIALDYVQGERATARATR